MSEQQQEFSVRRLIDEAFSISAKNQGAQKAQLEMPDVIATADVQTKEGVPLSVKNWIDIYDQFASWVINCAVLASMETVALEGGVSTQRRAVTCLMANVSSQVIAIRRLILAGLDVQAKQLVRMLTEQIDVLIPIALDKDSAEEFMLTEDANAANLFWHQRISKHKFRNMLFSAARDVLGQSDADEVISYIQDEEKLLGATVHPSIMASHAALLPMTETEDLHPFGFLGRVTVFSERTLIYSSIYMFLLLIFGHRLACDVTQWPTSAEKDVATTLLASIGL